MGDDSGPDDSGPDGRFFSDRSARLWTVIGGITGLLGLVLGIFASEIMPVLDGEDRSTLRPAAYPEEPPHGPRFTLVEDLDNLYDFGWVADDILPSNFLASAPDPTDLRASEQWMSSRGLSPVGRVNYKLIARAPAAGMTIVGVSAAVESVRPSESGTILCTGPEGEAPNIQLSIDLDSQDRAALISGPDRRSIPYFQVNSVLLAEQEVSVFYVTVRSQRGSYQWRLKVDYIEDGEEKSELVGLKEAAPIRQAGFSAEYDAYYEKQYSDITSDWLWGPSGGMPGQMQLDKERIAWALGKSSRSCSLPHWDSPLAWRYTRPSRTFLATNPQGQMLRLSAQRRRSSSCEP
jgi:hypothetical protein